MNTFKTTNFFHMKSIKNVYNFLFLIDGTMDHKALSFITHCWPITKILFPSPVFCHQYFNIIGTISSNMNQISGAHISFVSKSRTNFNHLIILSLVYQNKQNQTLKLVPQLSLLINRPDYDKNQQTATHESHQFYSLITNHTPSIKFEHNEIGGPKTILINALNSPNNLF